MINIHVVCFIQNSALERYFNYDLFIEICLEFLGTEFYFSLNFAFRKNFSTIWGLNCL